MAASLLHGLLALAAPPRCSGCDLHLPEPDGDPNAARIGQEPPPGGAFCPACEPLLEPAPPALAPPAAAGAGWLYQGPLADAIRRFKYGGGGWLAAPLGEMLAAAARPYTGSVEAVVPLPLHASKLRTRGYNPACLLARPVARELGVPLRVDWLRRVRATRTQAGLGREERMGNIRGAFASPPRPPSKLLVVDDVRTTGATLAEAAATLRAGGHEVFTLALAWADG